MTLATIQRISRFVHDAFSSQPPAAPGRSSRPQHQQSDADEGPRPPQSPHWPDRRTSASRPPPPAAQSRLPESPDANPGGDDRGADGEPVHNSVSSACSRLECQRAGPVKATPAPMMGDAGGKGNSPRRGRAPTRRVAARACRPEELLRACAAGRRAPHGRDLDPDRGLRIGAWAKPEPPPAWAKWLNGPTGQESRRQQGTESRDKAKSWPTTGASWATRQDQVRPGVPWPVQGTATDRRPVRAIFPMSDQFHRHRSHQQPGTPHGAGSATGQRHPLPGEPRSSSARSLGPGGRTTTIRPARTWRSRSRAYAAASQSGDEAGQMPRRPPGLHPTEGICGGQGAGHVRPTAEARPRMGRSGDRVRRLRRNATGKTPTGRPPRPFARSTQQAGADEPGPAMERHLADVVDHRQCRGHTFRP